MISPSDTDPINDPGTTLLSERIGDVVILTLNRPEQRNAMNDQLTAEWALAVADLADDESVRCVVITGAGPAFCAGGDLAFLVENSVLPADEIEERIRALYGTWLAFRELPMPTIAAVNGAAFGGGLALALACDLRYSTPQAGFAVPFSGLGIYPGMASTYLLPQAVGLPAALEMFLTGRTVRGEEAVRLGLVNGLFEADRLRAEALAIAATIAERAPLATRLTVGALRGGAPASLAAALAMEARAQPLTIRSADLLEGLAARRERRAPRFSSTQVTLNLMSTVVDKPVDKPDSPPWPSS